MGEPTVSQIENAFLPAKEITDTERFAGREGSVKDAYYALLAEGANIAVVGNRGIGKTSLSRQIAKIGSGDSSLLNKIELKHDGSLDFLTVYMACGSQISSTDELLERLLTSNSCLADWIYDIPSAKKIMVNYSPKFSAGVPGLGLELGGTKETDTTAYHAISNHSIDVVFTNVVDAIAKEKIAKNGVLIVVDEFDQIPDPRGFASFLKALATNSPNVKFCLVGVAKDIQALMKEHESTDRLFAGSIIHLDPMSPKELTAIITNAETHINDYIIFTPGAKDKLVSLSQGHPYMVHLIGKFALRNAFHGGKKEITEDDIDNTLADIAQRKADPILEGKYRKAVASSSHREIVLKSLAGVTDGHGEIWTTNAYRNALDKGVDNSSQYVGQLVTEEYGAEVEKLRDRYYRFKDSLFQAYVLARPAMYKENG